MKLLVNTKIVASLIIATLTSVLLFFHYDNMNKPYFDENHYVPAAIEWLHWAPTKNLEHPPFGKLLISAGISIFGDNPLGWRIMPLLAGILSVLLCFGIANKIYRNVVLAFNVALFSLFNFWFFVQSRIAMLDIFLVLFLLLGFYFYLMSQEPDCRNKKYFNVLSALSFGFAMAVKWSALFVYLPFFLYYSFVQFKFSKNTGYKINKAIQDILLFGFYSLASYYITFLPYLFVSTNYKTTFWDLFIHRQLEIFKLQKAVVLPHNYNSPWYQWPFMVRPTWYEFFKLEDQNSFKGIVLLGNPFQMIIGAIAVLAGVFRWEKLKPIGKVMLIFFLCSWLGWPLTSRKVSFFYYFLPSAIFYSFLIPFALLTYVNEKRTNQIMGVFVAISIAFFVYFYPILSGESSLMSSLIQYRWPPGWI